MNGLQGAHHQGQTLFLSLNLALGFLVDVIAGGVFHRASSCAGVDLEFNIA